MNLINLIIRTTLSTSLLLGVSNTYAVVAGGMVSTDYHWNNIPANGFATLENQIIITHEPGNDGNTFWANQFSLKNGNIGYVGLQQRSNDQKYLNFSIWKTTSWKSGYPAYCRQFDHEGDGVQCDLPYEWKEGTKYNFKIVKNNDSTVSAFVKDMSTGKQLEIAKINVPQTWGGFDSLATFTENFRQHQQPNGIYGYNSCNDVHTSVSATYSAIANSSIKSKSQTTKTYGNCVQVASAHCTDDSTCISTVNNGNYTQQKPFTLKNGARGFCADSLNGGQQMGLYSCDPNNGNQRLSTDHTHRLYLTHRDACLMGDVKDNFVKVAPCNNDSSQRWLYSRHTSQYINLKTSLCLDAADGANSMARLQMIGCQSNNSYQTWKITR
ncbi:DUF3472 domain-containing protein [Acinetobacter sp. YH16032]|uniref:RICIN domain-containing protein n=1 Tax=Acinetobacter sp. YH16032 TaxID=2601181 RepID=UPI0015D1AA67|nr:ricin-type beta-trefoil lectin domain protein [Acinetobacter sp. YH16032]